ncbi:MAG: hypothetical protein QMC43_06430 [Candidatus Poseidoniaceae archaeon]|jgi:hypothetical protein
MSHSGYNEMYGGMFMAGGLNTEMARLSHRDIRQRRRAIRVLFDLDIPRALEAFVPLLNDNDPWFRSKSLEAHRKWAVESGIESLKPLVEHKWIDANRCAASLLIQFGSESEKYAKILLAFDDLNCQRKAAASLLQDSENLELAQRLSQNTDYQIRKLAYCGSSADKGLRSKGLEDPNNSVKEAALRVIISNGEPISEQNIVDLIKCGIDSSLLSKPAINLGGDSFLKLIDSCPSNKNLQFSKVLSEMCNDVDDEQVQTLIKAGQLSIIARWLRGRKDSKSDALLWKLMDDDRLPTIEKARLLERLIGRAGEPEINAHAVEFAIHCQDPLLKVTAENLSTAAAELNI